MRPRRPPQPPKRSRGFLYLPLLAGLLASLVWLLPAPSHAQGTSSSSSAAQAAQSAMEEVAVESSDGETSPSADQEGGQQDIQVAPVVDYGVEDLERGVEQLGEKYPVIAGVIRVLTFPFLKVENTEITLLKLTIAFLLLIAGLILSKKLAGLARNRLFTRFRVQKAYSLFLERLIRALLIIIFAFWALQFTGIPLGIFAFLGGAIAIAVGFGGQELLANFISGVILMLEKPIREGDLVEFEGQRGRIEEIGPRSTRIMMPGNVDLLVPNRQLLENRIINWTFTDRQVRTEVLVGIAYGSDTRLFEQEVRKIIHEHERVDETPEPEILFDEFGDNSLVFTLFFWVTVNSFLEQRRIMSEMRFRIDEMCREKDITIAFPQRDVHLDTLSPLDIRLVDRDRDRPDNA